MRSASLPYRYRMLSWRNSSLLYKAGNIMSNCDAGKLSKEFLEDVSALIYHDMSVKELDKKFVAKKKYAESPKCLGFLSRMEGHREKACAALAKRLFTFGAVSTQRGEGANSEVKGKGSLKAMLAGADLVTLHLKRRSALTLMHAQG